MPRTASRTRRATSSRNSEITVKVARTGGRVQEVLLEDDRTVQGALSASGINHSATDRIRVNGRTASLSTTLSKGDIVTVAGKIQGGNR